MGLTQEALGKYVHHDAQSIARWEKNQTQIQETSDMVIRVLIVEKLNLGHSSIKEIAAKCVPSKGRAPDIIIDGSESPTYTLAA